MKYLFFLHINLCRNCASAHIFFDIIKKTLENNIGIDVVCCGNEEEYEHLNLKVFDQKVTFLVVPEKQIAKGNFIKRYLQEISYSKRAFSLYKNKKYDLVFLQSCNAAYFFIKKLKQLDCPIVFNVQDIFPYNLYYSHQLPFCRVSFPILRRLQHKAYVTVDRLITISDDMKNTIIKDGVAPDRIDVIYNWSYSDDPIKSDNILDSNLFKGFNKNKFNVVYAGNIGKMQNVGILGEVAKRLSDNEDIHFNIIGDGVNKQELIRKASGLNNVSFFEKQSTDLVESIYAQADLNVVTLAEGGIFTALPSKTATCLRTDKPCVFCMDTDSEFAKTISAENGVYVCNWCDIDKLVEIILSLANGGEHQISHIKFVERYMSSITNPIKYVQIMKDLL